MNMHQNPKGQTKTIIICSSDTMRLKFHMQQLKLHDGKMNDSS